MFAAQNQAKMRLMFMKPAGWVGLLAARLSVGAACSDRAWEICEEWGYSMCARVNGRQICCNSGDTIVTRRMSSFDFPSTSFLEEDEPSTSPLEEDLLQHRLLQGCREACPNGDLDCGEPHMQGLRGQKIDWSGVDGGWYSLIKDENADLHINVRVTAPLPEEFPDRQLMTSLAVLSEGHSVVIEVKNPYAIDTGGCPEGVSPCLANGGLRIIVDGQELDELLRFSRQMPVAEGAITLSASNLPAECRQFGGDRIWARMYQEMLEGRRQLRDDESLEEWILRYDSMAAPGWCAKYIADNDLADLQSNHAIFKIETSTVTVRLNAGVNYQGNGELNWDGRVLPDLEFWQMDVGMDGLAVDNPALSGLTGETARPVYYENGRAVMEGFDAFRGTVEDYRVSGALGVHFPLLDDKE